MMTQQSENLREILLHLSLIGRVGPSTVERLCTALGRDNLLEAYRWRARDLSMQAGLSVALSETIVQGLADRRVLEDELALIERYRVSWSTVIDDDYPDMLKHIHLPPLVFYWRGTGKVARTKNIAFVGSRMATRYSEIMLQRLIPPLIARDWVIVSGGALGADAMAHKIALNEGGSTVAVIGSGLLKPYPRAHISLFESIIDNNGVLMSPFPLTMSAVPGNFPARNRVIAGLSRSVIVVQAGEKSGALITASYALNEGRDVGAVPGAATDDLSIGCHALLRQGAFLIGSSADIFEMVQESPELLSEKRMEAAVDISMPHEEISEGISEQASRLLHLCRVPQSLEELHTGMQLSLGELHDLLSDLHLAGHIEQTIQGLWLTLR